MVLEEPRAQMVPRSRQECAEPDAVLKENAQKRNPARKRAFLAKTRPFLTEKRPKNGVCSY
jgi:hypothetical protein